MRRQLSWALVAAVVAVVTAGGMALAADDDDYQLNLMTPSAGQLFVGGNVLIHGQQVGKVTDLGVEGNKARVTISLDSDHAPVRAGTTARVSWSSVIGAQAVDLAPGPAANPVLPSGKMITESAESVQLDDLLATIDPQTRQHLQGLVGNLQGALQGRERNLHWTVSSAGPAVQAAGEVLRSAGQDGPAIRDLVTQVRGMMQQLSQRGGQLGGVVDNVGDLSAAMAGKQDEIKQALAALPSTVQQATRTLGQVPGSVDKAKPLLADVRPATSKLPEVAGNLSPVLQKLRPAVGQLRPTLDAANGLLAQAPQLLDTAHQTVPGVTQALQQASPAVSFLRPYTPELAGWLSTWNSTFGSVANNGRHTARALITGSGSSPTDNPGLLPPGMKQEPRPAPGSLANQPWTDADGSGLR